MDTKEKDWGVLAKKYPFVKCGYCCGLGWYDILDEMLEEVVLWYEIYRPDELDEFHVLQIKEKYGTLVVYTGGTYEEVLDIITSYEMKSHKICEWCGDAGHLTELGYWYRTLCTKCYNELLEERGQRK